MVQSCSPGTPPNQVRPFQPHCSAVRPSLGDQNALWSPHSSCPVPALGLGRTGCNHTGGGQGVTPGALTQASCPSTDSPPPLSRWPNPNGSAHCGDLTVCAGLSRDPLGILAESRTGTGQGCRAGLRSCHHSMLSAHTHALEGAGLGAKSDGNCGSHCRLDAAGRHRGTCTELGACELQGLEVPSITAPHTHLEVNLN